MNQKTKTLFALIFILSLAALFHSKCLTEFPSHTHAWAQADRYALSLRFADNDLNFFQPETYVLNPEFPHKWKKPHSTSITSVDFPIHDYIPAVFMKLSGSKAPVIFRTYIILYSIIGLLFLFKLAQRITGDFLKSMLVLAFAATSPLFVYYQGSFLPTIPSLANAIIGIYFYFVHIKENKSRAFWIGIIFLTLAALSRSTFAIVLLSVLGVETLRIFRKEADIKKKILPVLLSLSLLVGYFLYNQYLRNNYGSIFLGHLMYPGSFEEAREILQVIREDWLTTYFSKIHYYIVLLLILGFVIQLLRRKVKFGKPKSYFLLLIVIMFFGCVVFSGLMLRQFTVHDYYFLDTFFLPLILLTAFLLSCLPQLQAGRLQLVFAAIVVFVSFPLVISAYQFQQERHKTVSWDRIGATIDNFSGSKDLLNEVGVGEDEKILVLNPYAPNIPFILMDRKGYVVMNSTRENVQNALQWDHDYVVIQNEFFTADIYSVYPQILSELERVGGDVDISVYERAEENLEQTIPQFLGLNSRNLKLEESITFEEDKNGKQWQNILRTSELSASGNFSTALSDSVEFGLTYSAKNLDLLGEKNHILLCKANVYAKEMGDCELVVTLTEDGESVFYNSKSMGEVIRTEKEWKSVSFIFQIPRVKSGSSEIKVYFWNNKKADLLIDDFSVEIY